MHHSIKRSYGFCATVPLLNGREHFYTTNSNEIGVTTPGHVGNHRYRSEGIAGYCFPRQYHDTVHLYRYWNGADHFYTTNWHEIGTNVIGHTGQSNVLLLGKRRGITYQIIALTVFYICSITTDYSPALFLLA